MPDTADISSYDALLDYQIAEQLKYLASIAASLYPPTFPPPPAPPPSPAYDGMDYTLIGALSVAGLAVFAAVATTVAAHTNNKVRFGPWFRPPPHPRELVDFSARPAEMAVAALPLVGVPL